MILQNPRDQTLYSIAPLTHPEDIFIDDNRAIAMLDKGKVHGIHELLTVFEIYIRTDLNPVCIQNQI